MKEWLCEARAMDGSEARAVFASYKKTYERLGREAAESNRYYLRYLDWAPQTTKDMADRNTPSDTEIVDLPPDTLEACIARYLSRPWNRQYQHRFRNVNTGETIPAEIFCE